MKLSGKADYDEVAQEFRHVMGNDDEYKFNDKNHDHFQQPGEVTETDPGSIMENFSIHGVNGDSIEVDSRDRHIYKALKTADKEKRKSDENNHDNLLFTK